MTIELRMCLIEEGHEDKWVAYRFTDEQVAMMKPVARNPIAMAMATQRERDNDPKQHIIRVGRMLSETLADYRDDRDGRNGERRAEMIARRNPSHDQD